MARDRRVPLATAAAIALVASAGCGSAAPADRSPPAPAVAAVPAVRVMTWNIERGQAVAGRVTSADMAPFAAVVAGNGADIVGLQEVTLDQAAAISGALGWGDPRFVQTKNPCPGFAPPLPASCIPFGNAILSRYPQSHTEQWLLPPSALESALEDRVLLRSVVDAAGVRLSVYVTHLAADATVAERQAQVAEALAHIDDDGRTATEADAAFVPVLVGDFNAIPTNDAVTMVTDGFVNAWDELRPDERGFTSNAVLSLTRRLDYVFVGRESGLGVEEVSVDPHVLSDHLPVIATLTTRGA